MKAVRKTRLNHTFWMACSFALALLFSVAALAEQPSTSVKSQSQLEQALFQGLIEVRHPALSVAQSLNFAEEHHPQLTAGPPRATSEVRTALRPDLFSTQQSSAQQSFVRKQIRNYSPAPVRAIPSPALKVPPSQLAPAQTQPSSSTPPGGGSPLDEDFRLRKISGRYHDSRMLTFLQNTSANQQVELFLEVSNMIDTRHVSPTAYEERTRQAIHGLQLALSNPDYLQVLGSTVDPDAVKKSQADLEAMLKQPARSQEDAVAAMQMAASSLSRKLGIRPEVVSLEFLNATLDSLDRYSAFVPAKTGAAPGAVLEEHIVGIGVELKTDPNGALVQGTVENSPAERAGVQKGDLIVAINDQKLAGKPLNQIADMISGPLGTTLKMELHRNNRRLAASIVRETIFLNSVTGATMVDEKQHIGYLRLKQFSESSAEELEKAMWKLYNAGMDNIILDLRGNPGGLLSESIEVSNLFVPKGVLVSTRGRTPADNMEERATRTKAWKLPLVVLIDEHSASASEILAAAIQENGRGVIVGRRSYGKGTVQTHFPLQTVAGELKLTTAKFYSPKGREMAGAGVTPDVVVPAAQGEVESLATDPDVQSACKAIADGVPAQLAVNAGQTTPQVQRGVYEELAAP